MSNSYIIKPVGLDNWPDLEVLFESKGGPHPCWCMVWRKNLLNDSENDKQSKKRNLKAHISRHGKIGLVAYCEGRPIGWCSVAPRESYKALGGNSNQQKVWSLVCFYIQKEFRGMGVKQELIKAAKGYARSNGASYLEAFPVDKTSPSYRFMGFISDFEEGGFSLQGQVGKRRNLMTFKL